MPYIEPKTNWTTEDAPLPSDMNRIEGNSVAEKEARENAINAEASARQTAINAAINAEANTRYNADMAEANTRASADGTLQAKINNEANTRAYYDQCGVLQSSRTLPSGGLFIFVGDGGQKGVQTGGFTFNSSYGEVLYWRIS